MATSKAGDVQNIYVELDVLLDTRLSTLASMNPESAIVALETDYHVRQEDRFLNVDFNAFKEAYAKRDVETLKNARVTEGVNLLKNMCYSLLEQTVTMPYHSGVKLFVNTYPYKLSDEEIIEIGKAIFKWVGSLVPVEMIYLDPKELTPSHCKSTFITMIMYTNYAQWLELHVEEFKRVQMPTVSLLVPAIFDCGKPTDEQMQEILKEAGHPFVLMEKSFIQFIALELIDIKYFSLLKPQK